MFKSYKYIKNNGSYIIYQIIDDDFICEIKSSIYDLIIFDFVQLYLDKNLPIVPNVVQFYYYNRAPNDKLLHFVELDARLINKRIKSINYYEDYYPIIKNHLEKLIMLG